MSTFFSSKSLSRPQPKLESSAEGAINFRTTNLAQLLKQKAQLDATWLENNKNNPSKRYKYFDDELRNKLTYFNSSAGVLVNNEGVEIPYSSSLLYAVLPDGRLCAEREYDLLPNEKLVPTTKKLIVYHSQFNAGQDVQAAGYLRVTNGVITYIDNNSGHYTPTFSQLLSTVLGLHEANIIKDIIKVNFNRDTKFTTIIPQDKVKPLAQQAFNVLRARADYKGVSLSLTFQNNGKVEIKEVSDPKVLPPKIIRDEDEDESTSELKNKKMA